VKVLLFCAFGLKTPIHSPKIGGFGGFLPLKWRAVTTEFSKGTCGCENTSFGAKIVKIGAIVAEILRFFDIFKIAVVRHLGFAGARIWAIRKHYLAFFIFVQNLVGIDAVGLIL